MSILSVLATPGLKPLHPYPLEKLLLQSRITGKLGRQLNVGNWTEDQALWQMPDQALGGREPKLRIILTNIEQYRCINDPSHLLLLAFPQFRKHLVRTALRKTVFLGEIQSSHRIGFNDYPRLDQDPTLRRGDFLPKNGLTWGEMHVAPQFCGYGHLPAFCNGRFHMIIVSCVTAGSSVVAFESSLRKICWNNERVSSSRTERRIHAIIPYESHIVRVFLTNEIEIAQ